MSEAKPDWTDLFNDIAEAQGPDSGSIIKLVMNDSQSAMYCCELWKGFMLWANEIRDEHIVSSSAAYGRFFTLNYCISGRCEVRMKDRDMFIYMNPGMLCIDAGHEPEDGYYYPGRRYEGIEIAVDLDAASECMPQALADIGIDSQALLLKLKEKQGTMIGMASENAGRMMTDLYAQLVNSDMTPEDYRFYTMRLCYELLHGGWTTPDTLSYATKGQRTIANDAEAVLTRDLSRHIKITDLAEKYGVSSSALKKYFEVVYGNNISGYLRAKRMELAMQMLSETTDSIGTIAAAAGYSHQGKFGAAFREYTGVTPLEYRRLHFSELK